MIIFLLPTEGADEHLAMDGIHQLSDLTSSTLTESPLLAGMWRTIRSKQTVGKCMKNPKLNFNHRCCYLGQFWDISLLL